MSYHEILALATTLSKDEQLQLILSLSHLGQEEPGALRSRCTALINKQEPCPHCGGKHYRRYGKARGAQRFKCKDCNRTFTEYTGTWLDGIHKKSLAKPYMSLMIEEYSLDKIKEKLPINTKTAFDWRHKILSSYEQNIGKDRSKSLKMTVSTMGRVTKSDIKESLQHPLPKESILCSDGQVSYKGYSIDNNFAYDVLIMAT